MRDIKFRIWSDYLKGYLPLKGECYYYDPINKEHIKLIDEHINYFNNGNTLIIEQYTGVKDENGKEIYEGDILFDDFNNEIGYVVWNEDDLRYEICFYDSEYVDVYELLDKNYANGLKIVGNLHDKKNKK